LIQGAGQFEKFTPITFPAQPMRIRTGLKSRLVGNDVC